MLDLAFVALLTLWAAVVGGAVLRRFGEPSETLALALPLGFGLLALAALGLAECGLLNPAGLAVVGVAGLGWHVLQPIVAFRSAKGAFPARRTGVWKRDLSRSGRRRPEAVLGFPPPCAIALAALLALALVGTLATALAPVTDGDALCYHLQVPKVFLSRHSAVFDPDLHETVYPLVTEMLYAVALAFRGPVACRLIQWVLGLVFALNVTALARPVLGPRAWWAGAVALLVPAVSNGMSAPLNDVALAAFGTAALVAWMQYEAEPSVPGILLAGALAGLALGVKYPALVLTGILLIITLARRPRHALLFAATAALVGGVWYTRAAWFTGNPVYPFFRNTFGGAGLDEVLEPVKRPLVVSPANLLTALGPMTLQPDRFDSFAHQFGPAFLLFLPALFLERPPRRVWGLAAIGYAFLTVCLTQRQSMRFVLLALGPLAVAVAWLVVRWHDRRSVAGRVLVGLFLGVLAFETGLAVVRARHGLPAVVGRESADAFLARREPTYRVGAWVARNLPSEAHLIGQDHRGYYIPRPYTMELAHRRRTGLGRNGESPEAIVERLRDEGFTHLLLCPPVPEDAVEFDPTLGRILAPWLARHTPLYRERLSDADGVVRRYAVYQLAQRGRP